MYLENDNLGQICAGSGCFQCEFDPQNRKQIHQKSAKTYVSWPQNLHKFSQNFNKKPRRPASLATTPVRPRPARLNTNPLQNDSFYICILAIFQNKNIILLFF